jgi:hypothetical protein
MARLPFSSTTALILVWQKLMTERMLSCDGRGVHFQISVAVIQDLNGFVLFLCINCLNSYQHGNITGVNLENFFGPFCGFDKLNCSFIR